MSKISKFFFIILVISVFIGIGISNMELNRMIYCNEVHMKTSEQSYRNMINKFDLNDMEKKLDTLENKINNPQEYKTDDNDLVFKITIPKYRVLFNFMPFDLRFETEKYRLCINGKIIDNLHKKIYKEQIYLGDNKEKIIKNLESVDEKIYNVRSDVSKYKLNVNNYLK
ncbi:hypothetical protein [Clostridium akagii]|uniref:hypothetical protein n=1 Tax=Clostridium akagii TaxID=91623 RepID=UPI00055A39F1|nr:hypothetical protein [Clostridium akagii]